MGHQASVLRSYDSWRGSINDFSWLDDVTTGASDIDQVIERRGWVVFFEGKPIIDGKLTIPTGQYRMLETLARPTNQQVWVVAHAGEKMTDGPLHILTLGAGATPAHTRQGVQLGGRRVWCVVFPALVLPALELHSLRDRVGQWWSWCGDNPYGGDW
jgi:hypothetical protein